MLLTDVSVGVMTFILVLYVLYMCMNKKFCATDCMLAFIGLVMLVFVYVMYMLKTYRKDGFKAPVNYHIENVFTGMNKLPNTKFPYDNLTESELLNSVVEFDPENANNTTPVAANSTNHELVNPVYYSPVGTEHHLKLDPNQAAMKPSVNGLKDGPKALSMFAFNVFKPECCSSSYSGDRGCVCMTNDQKAYLARGGSVV